MNAVRPKPHWLIFVDTNVLLDFYRLDGELLRKQLDGLRKHLGSLIVTEQVRMEFLKNRQKVILEGMNKITKPNDCKPPMIVAESKPAQAFTTSVKQSIAAHRCLKDRLSKILRDPKRYDPVYNDLAQVFFSSKCLNLRRPDKRRFQIRKLAIKRFLLGYPPRKVNDTSIVDAINWEWIVYCAQQQEQSTNVLIVSRDNDYGQKYGDQWCINDWLKAEFVERTRPRNKIELSDRLSVALRKLNEPVDPRDEQAEQKVIMVRPDPIAIDLGLNEPRIQGN